MKVAIDYTWEPEELQHSYEFRITAVCEPGEPEVRYYPDGSGYPGSPPTVEDIEVSLGEVTGDEGTHSGLSEPYRSELEQTFTYQLSINPAMLADIEYRLFEQANSYEEDHDDDD